MVTGLLSKDSPFSQLLTMLGLLPFVEDLGKNQGCPSSLQQNVTGSASHLGVSLAGPIQVPAYLTEELY